MAKLTLTVEEVRSRLHYDPLTGDFTWLSGRRKGKKAGYAAKYKNYSRVIIVLNRGCLHKAHRLAFLWMTGEFPEQDVDHINGDPLDNRWDNLRRASKHENLRNCSVHKDNKAGLKGVCVTRKRPTAQIYLNGKRTHLGTFDTVEEAHAAYCAAAEKHFGEFARFG